MIDTNRCSTSLPPGSPLIFASESRSPKARFEDIKKEIARLDMMTTFKAVPFQLKQASAAQVLTMIQNFYAQRYP